MTAARIAFASFSPSPVGADNLAQLALRWRTLQEEIDALEALRDTAESAGWKAALSADIDALMHDQVQLVAAAAAVRTPHPEGMAAKLALLEAFVEAHAVGLSDLAGTPFDLFSSLHQDLAALSRSPS